MCIREHAPAVAGHTGIRRRIMSGKIDRNETGCEGFLRYYLPRENNHFCFRMHNKRKNMRGKCMPVFQRNSYLKRFPKIILCVLLTVFLWLPSGCQIFLPKDDRSAASDEKNEDRDSSDETKKEETVKNSNKTDKAEETKRAVYTMDLTLDTDEHSIGGSLMVDVTNYSEDDWDSLCFRDYPSLFTKDFEFVDSLDGKISEISNIRDKDNDEELTMERSQEDVSVIDVKLEDPIKPGETRRISMDFISYVPEVPDRFGYMNDMYNLSNFYPVLAVYEDGDWVAHRFVYMGECFYSLVSDYYVTFHLPTDMTLACSGEETKIDDGKWSVAATNVRDISAVIAEGFAVVTDEIDGVAVNCYYTEDKEWADIAVDAGIRSIEAFNDAFGSYPYPEIDIIQTELFAGGMEYPSIVLIYRGFEANPNPDETLSIVVAHEIAHQWFYSLVGNDQYDEAWLDESFASYAEYVYMETYIDVDKVASRVSRMQDVIMGGSDFNVEDDELRLNRPYDDFPDDNSYVHTVYNFGQVFLYRLREKMGDEDFTAMMKAYVEEFSHKVATSGDFVEYVHIYAGDDDEVDELLEVFLAGVE